MGKIQFYLLRVSLCQSDGELLSFIVNIEVV